MYAKVSPVAADPVLNLVSGHGGKRMFGYMSVHTDSSCKFRSTADTKLNLARVLYCIVL
eukprot:SAG31_NODE_8270_length_1484_cov_1.728520_1_plen_59_part_00